LLHQYPVPRQIGQTWVGNGGYSYPQGPSDGSGYGTDPLYIWNNSGTGGAEVGANQLPDNCGHNLQISNFIMQGRDYVLSAKPGYKPYPYPHPLRSSVGATPTPSPTPTPTHSATQTWSVFSARDTPAVVTWNDPNPVELGVKFQSSVAGTVTGIRFYKGPKNTGRHVAHLWSATGALLAIAAFPNETASGWQQVYLSRPVTLIPGTTYVVSYHTNGFYSGNGNYFGAAHTTGPLTAPASWPSGGNGVYAYGSTSSFPTSSYNSSNYWVDVAFLGTGETHRRHLRLLRRHLGIKERRERQQ